MSMNKRSLDAYLEEVYKQFIFIKDSDFKRAQEVFKSVFEQVKQKVGEQCNFFKKYSSQVTYGGSVYDGTKVGKMDEFDMDIVIRLPINYEESENGIIIENDTPGYVKLKIINAFDNLDKQKEWENCHKVTRDWRDAKKYFLQNKFRHWMHSIVQKALNEMDMKATVNDVTYLLNYKESGPAYTLHIRNPRDDEQFRLDVDLVPVLRFISPRWPKGYRTVEKGTVKDWFVVPKPNKALKDDALRNRCWRLSFQEYEREMLEKYNQLKKTIRLVKKLRNALNMKPIASYYIKTLFLWKVQKNKDANIDNKQFWQRKVSILFRTMVEEFHDAIINKNIPYFWNKDNNLIEQLKPEHQKLYADQLNAVLQSIDTNDVIKTVHALLTPDEFKLFMNTDLYLKHAAITPTPVSTPTKVHRSYSTVSSSSSQDEQANSQASKLDQQTLLLKTVMKKLDLLTQKLEIHEERLFKLEEAHKQILEMKLQPSKNTTDAGNVDLLINAAVPEVDGNVLISF